MLRNLRDIGGIRTKDGRQIRKGIYIRSAILKDLTIEDKNYIYSDLGVTRVIDIRTDTEVHRKPDMAIPHVAYIHFPLQKEEERSTNDVAVAMDRLRAAKTPEERYELVPRMENIYRCMLTSDFSRTNLRALISSLIGYNIGATLYHCTSGKDRTGMVTAILLTVLGVGREEIMEDYMKSLPSAREESDALYRRVIEQSGDEKLATLLAEMFLVKEDYLNSFWDEYDRQFGSDEDFIHYFLRIDDNLLNWYKSRVLE